jgi:hypothetical protein
MVMKIHVVVICTVTPCGDALGGCMVLRNVCIPPHHYTASHNPEDRDLNYSTGQEIPLLLWNAIS